MFLVGACSTLSPNPPREATSARPPAPSGEVAKLSRGVRSAFGAKRSGFHLLTKNSESLLWRLALIDHATTSIDIQYFIWERDDSGLLLFSRLLDAADRGVRVRILVDDFMYSGNEERLAALCRHPNLSVRIFNPQKIRSGMLGPVLEFAANFRELNRRMHNKVFLVDNRAAIMGGRNVGNEYFGLSEKYNYLDLDVLTAGPVVPEISKAFDEFWNSDPAYPWKAMSQSVGPADFEDARASVRASYEQSLPALRRAGIPTERKNWASRFRDVSSKWHPGTAIVLQDSPEIDPGKDRRRFLDSTPRMGSANNPVEWLAVSPYLIPGKRLFESIERYSGGGGEVKMLTSSLGSTDQPWVYSHYAKHRRKLTKNGAELSEFRPDATDTIRSFTDTPPNSGKKVSLHMKTAVGNRERCFIGSLNLDPRSIDINTENGLFIESPTLASELAEYIDMIMSEENVWRVVRPDSGGKLSWRSRGKESAISPAPSLLKRVGSWFFLVLPIESQL